MKEEFIKGLKDSYTLILCKISGEKVGTIFYENLTSLSRGIEKVSELSFTVNKYYGKDGQENPLYNELKVERLIKLDDTETYVIKNITEQNNTLKTVTAFSREKKLFKIAVEIEDICITLKTKDENVPNSYTLDELLYDETGWKLGYISPRVQYVSDYTIMDILQDKPNERNCENCENKDEPCKCYLTTTEKLRYQESISSNWYDYIMNEIADQFECYPVFDSYNKVIDLYDEMELGDNLQLILSYDNYLKSKERTTDTEDIVTRLVLSGNNDLNVVGCNPTGYKYIEDFSYFMENGEMSPELTNDLNIYNKVTKGLIERWNELRQEKLEKENKYTEEQRLLLICYSSIRSLESAVELTDSDSSYRAVLYDQLEEANDRKTVIENGGGFTNLQGKYEEYIGINVLYNQIKELSKEITEINMLCKKKYATKNGMVGGEPIFNEERLNELKEFIYQDTYSNDCITNEEDLMKLGMRKLSEMKYPTKTWSVDVVNFIERLIDNEFRVQWNGQLGLGDMIILKGEDIEEAIYLVGYTQNFKDKTLQLELSNKKGNKEFSLSIGERLTQAKEVYKNYKNNKYLLNSIKLNRVGVKYDKINGKIL